MITPLWLSGSLRSFLYSSSVYSCHLFLISSTSVRSKPFLSFYCAHLRMRCSFGIPNFPEEISSLSHFLFVCLFCFPIFLCIVHLGRLSYLFLLFFVTLHSDGYIFLFLLLPFASLLFSAICMLSSDNHIAFLPLGIFICIIFLVVLLSNFGIRVMPTS